MLAAAAEERRGVKAFIADVDMSCEPCPGGGGGGGERMKQQM
jgi:hypothetical protein